MCLKELKEPRREPLLVRAARYLQRIHHRKQAGLLRFSLDLWRFLMIGINALILVRLSVSILVAHISQIVQIEIVEEIAYGILLLNLVYFLFENKG